jgi:hypothetical protein
MEVTASIGDDEFLVSGFWVDWPTSGAAGMPIVIHNDGIDLDITLIGARPSRPLLGDIARLVGNRFGAAGVVAVFWERPNLPTEHEVRSKK